MNHHRGRGRGRGGYYRSSRNYNHQQQQQAVPNTMTKPETNVRKAISHDNNCCSAINLVLDLDIESATFLNKLREMWTMLKKSQPVVMQMHQHFSSSTNPYEQTLRLIYNCPDFYNAKSKTLPFFIIEEFKDWLSSNKHKVGHLLTNQLKIDAFKTITKQYVWSLVRLVADAFELHKSGDIFLDTIRCMIEKKKYREACQCAVLFGQQDKFSVEDFLVPLILQDKLYGIDEFLESSPRHQIELITLLDSVLGKASIREALSHYVFKLEVPEIKWDKMYAKPFKKLIARLVKTFKLPSDLTPNFNKKRNEGALQFLIYKKYNENTFGNESFREMIQEAVGDDVDLQRELIVQVCQHGDVAEALRWAHFYNIDKQYWPYNVRMLSENPEEERLYQRNVLQEDSWDVNEEQKNSELMEYHKFGLEFADIQLVDSVQKFEHFLRIGLQGVEIVGIDCEWKPSFGGQRNELALMQIATRKNVFILDTITLMGTQSLDLWQQLGNYLFNNCDILKLGFGFTSDITMIKKSLPGLNFTPNQVGFIDLLSLWQTLEKQPKFVFPFEVQSNGASLSLLVNLCMGRPLDKSDQFSNWEKRPLRDSQLKYAANDALCLIEIFDVMRKCCEKSNINFDDTCFNLMTNEKAPKKKPKKQIKQNANLEEDIPQPPSPHVIKVPSNSLKVVCDTMLQGLGKNLRKCGIDTQILNNDMDHMECVRFAQDEHRFILTRGNVFNKLQGYVPRGHCLRIVSDNLDEQLKQFIDYYKVEVTKDDVFSVCQSCNGKSFVMISRSTMWALLNATGRNDDYDDVDEATGFSSDEECEYEPSVPVGYTRKWDLYSDENIDFGLCKTKKGAKIQVENIPPGVVEKVETFYVCELCGKTYWDGSHLDRVLTGRLQGIVQ